MTLTPFFQSAYNGGRAMYDITATPTVAFNANFDENYQAYNSTNVGQAGSSYTVIAGDTLQSIAQAVWGDSSLWYVLAQANGLSADSPLAAGRTLSIPDNVTVFHNSSGVFKPYNALDAMGNTQPTLPQEPQPPAPKHGGCGVIGDVIATIVSFVVEAVVQFYTHDSQLAAAAGDATRQGIEILAGNQKKFNWKELKSAWDTAGFLEVLHLSPGLNNAKKAADGASSLWNAAVRGMERNVVQQGVNMVEGGQKKFDWTGLAVAGASGAATKFAGDWAQSNNVTNQVSFGVLTGGAALLAGAATRTMVTHDSFGKSLKSMLPDAIGSTIGGIIADDVSAKLQADKDAKEAARKAIADAYDDQYGPNAPRKGFGVDPNFDVSKYDLSLNIGDGNADTFSSNATDLPPGQTTPDLDNSDYVSPEDFGFGTSRFDDMSYDGWTCFVAGTMVHTEQGLRPIEQVAVGEMVAGRDEHNANAPVLWRQVVNTFEHFDRQVLRLVIKHPGEELETILTTSEHPFFVAGNWRLAEELEVGDRFERIDGRQSELVETTTLAERRTVYNLTVDQDHTYFVGDVGIWVHNKKPMPGKVNPSQAGEIKKQLEDALAREAKRKAEAEAATEAEATVAKATPKIASKAGLLDIFGNFLKAGGEVAAVWGSAQMLSDARARAQSKDLTDIMDRYKLDKNSLDDWGAAAAYLRAQDLAGMPGQPLRFTSGYDVSNKREWISVMLLERAVPGSFESAMMGDDSALQMYQGMLSDVRARPMPRKGVAYTTTNDSERRIAEDMRVSGASSEAIQNALEVYRIGTDGSSAKVSSGAPSWLKVVQQGIQFDRTQSINYTYNQVYLKGASGGYVILDSYDPLKGPVSRKFTQLGGIKVQTALAYISEAAMKYAPGTEIARVPSTPPELVGTRLRGTLYLEVPVQKPEYTIPKQVLDAAKRSNVVIRDINGKIYK
jgi:LysM repeat protein